MMKSKKFKFIFSIIIFIIFWGNINVSFSAAPPTWYTLYKRGDYDVENIGDETYIGLIEALTKAVEFEDQQMLEDYKKCVDNIQQAGKNLVDVKDKNNPTEKEKKEMEKMKNYFFNKYSEPQIYDSISSKITEAESKFNSPLTEEEKESKKDAFKKYSKEKYKSPNSQTVEDYWKALEESSQYVSEMNKEELNLYVKCLNAFGKSGAGSNYIYNNGKQSKFNAILLEIFSRHYGKLDKDSKEIMEDTGNVEYEYSYFIFKQPSVSDASSGTTDSIDGLLTDSEKFLDSGQNNKIKDESIQDFSKTMYNILITIATFIAVLVGGILGVKIMISSADEKAQVKELLIPYVIGCVVVFGAFGIWKLVVTILQNI